MMIEDLQANRPDPKLTHRLFNGINLDNWAILSKDSHVDIENGELIIEGTLHTEVGGMSWDDYRVSLDVFIECPASPGHRDFNVQLCPRGTSTYAQLTSDGFTIACWDPSRDPHFTHLAVVSQPIPIGVWHRFEILVRNDEVTIFFNQEQVAHARIPIATQGMLGLIVNDNSDARVRLRNIQIIFLKPTPQQLRELQTSAGTNWEDFKRREVQAGRRKDVSDDSLELTPSSRSPDMDTSS